ncbi:putative conjugative transfer TraG domain protein [Orientia chuto str. Dubai]|uniref:Putative conjugative transfer TraG domain protein n=2 Tax=Candidatus Orientia mediorientalis TaxID=911112 RepID=A0A0F3MFL4_9RICK|nr:putative conjugative transfer TraG domain protein [Orientia chuto str. Dubai]
MYDGGRGVTTTADGRQIIAENVDSLVNNYRSSALLQSGYQNQFMRSQSFLDSLTKRESELVSTGNSMAMEIGQRLSHDEAKSIGLTDSESQALQVVSSDGIATTEHTGSSHSKSSGTSASVGVDKFGFNSRVLGNQNNEVTQGNSANQQQSYSEALLKIQSAVREGRFNVTDSKVQSLSENLNANLSEQQSIGQEIAKTKQEMEQLSHSINYVSHNSAIIDRNINELVLNEIINQIPEVNSKEQAARWARDHSDEAEKIAFKVAQINDAVPQDLNHDIDGISSKQDLQNAFEEKIDNLRNQASNNIKMHIEQQSSITDTEKVEHLNRISDSIKNKAQKIEKEFDNISNSAVILVGKEAVEAGKEVLEAVINKKD